MDKYFENLTNIAITVCDEEGNILKSFKVLFHTRDYLHCRAARAML